MFGCLAVLQRKLFRHIYPQSLLYNEVTNMKLAVVLSNNISISNVTKKGTEIFAYILLKELVKYNKKETIEITAFASGDSDLPVKIESIDRIATSLHKNIPDKKTIIFELALLAQAFSKQDEFDLYHINIGDGDISLPFAQFVKKPIIITLHNTNEKNYVKKFFSLYKSLKNVHFISISNAQRKSFPNLNYLDTIYHGIDIKKNNFTFSATGGDSLLWVGRAIPKKGMDLVIQIAEMTKKNVNLFPTVKTDYNPWFQHQIDKLKDFPPFHSNVSVKQNLERHDLIKEYQANKVFLFPVLWEEPFGLVMIESMACGTPVIAYARGSVPEIIKDGETGFIVNPSAKDKRGDWIIKKTGIAGLCEAVERMYAMPDKKYQAMRNACRIHVENNFTVERMVDNYVNAYKKVLTPSIT
jgi:glycosyltransferase involved in cell wall biosynthesis